MPILDFEIIGPVKQNNNLSQSLADAAAIIFNSKPGTTWVKMHFLPHDQYAENGAPVNEVYPVFVSVLLGQNLDENVRSKTALELAEVTSHILGRPRENIHVLFQPEAVGRIAFAGHLKIK